MTHHLTVVSENSDGFFVTHDKETVIVYSQNAWWIENGHLYLNLKWLRYTVESNNDR